jgi:ribonuclease HI
LILKQQRCLFHYTMVPSVYVDGSYGYSSDGELRGGIGLFYGPENPHNKSFIVSCDGNENHLVEAMAIRSALILNKLDTGFTIMTDSDFCANTIANTRHVLQPNGRIISYCTSRLTMNQRKVLVDCARRIAEYGKEGKEIKIQCIKAHSTDFNNRAADRLAYAAMCGRRNGKVISYESRFNKSLSFDDIHIYDEHQHEKPSISAVPIPNSSLHEFVYQTEFGNRIALGTSQDNRRDSMSTTRNLDDGGVSWPPSASAIPVAGTGTSADRLDAILAAAKEGQSVSKKQQKKLDKETKRRAMSTLCLDEDQVPKVEQEEDSNELLDDPIVLSQTASPGFYFPDDNDESKAEAKPMMLFLACIECLEMVRIESNANHKLMRHIAASLGCSVLAVTVCKTCLMNTSTREKTELQDVSTNVATSFHTLRISLRLIESSIMCKSALVTAGDNLGIVGNNGTIHHISIAKIGRLCDDHCIVRSIETGDSDSLGTAHPYLRMGFL